MAAKPKDKDVIRCALLDAVEWEKSLRGAYANVATAEGAEIRSRITAKIEAFEALLNKRYGGTAPEPTGKMVDIRDI